jgi:hypothetical protein
MFNSPSLYTRYGKIMKKSCGNNEIFQKLNGNKKDNFLEQMNAIRPSIIDLEEAAAKHYY